MNEQLNNAPNPKNNAASGYQGPVKIELLKGTGLLEMMRMIPRKNRLSSYKLTCLMYSASALAFSRRDVSNALS